MMPNFNLDDTDAIRALDRAAMFHDLEAFPDQLADAWQAAQFFPLPQTHSTPRLIVLCGMGGSAIGGDLVAALLQSSARVPFLVSRGYDLPAYADGQDVLLIANSYSGNTEETLSAAEQAATRDVRMLAITTGGALAEQAQAHGYPLWQFDYHSQPRAALGWSFGLLLGLAYRLGLAPTLADDVPEAVETLRAHAGEYALGTPTPRNPAKRTAGQLIGRMPVVFGAGIFEPVARRWKTQYNENAKVWAQYEPLPEADHNVVVSIEFPAEHGLNVSAQFITSRTYDHPRVHLRHELTYKMCLQHGIMADVFSPHGRSALAQVCQAVQYGDYVSFYLAAAYDVDPSTIVPIVELKEQLAQHA